MSEPGGHRPVLKLRPVEESDLPVFFAQQSDLEAVRLSGLAPRPHDVFYAHYAQVLQNPVNVIRTIEVDGEPAGHVATFPRDGRQEIGYWLGREYWGRGIVTWAFAEFLRDIRIRPLHAITSENNVASLRLLERAGFKRETEIPDFGAERGQGIVGVVMRLD